MSFEMPSNEQPKSEAEQISLEMEKIQNEILGLPEDAPEKGWLKEKLQSLDERLNALEKPTLRTQESYGVQKEKDPEIEREHKTLDTYIENIRNQKKRDAS